jgi:hypothetical protein
MLRNKLKNIRFFNYNSTPYSEAKLGGGRQGGESPPPNIFFLHKNSSGYIVE